MRARANNTSGGGVGIDLLSPNVVSQTTVTGNGSHTVAVAQKPKYIIRTQCRNDNVDFIFFYDCKNETIKYWGYTGAAWTNGADLAWSTGVSAISDSSVTMKSTTSTNTYSTALVYY